MKKPEGFRRVWAWESDPKEALYLIAISELLDNKILCVDKIYEEEFYDHDISYSMFDIWTHWSETDPRESKERWMTREEILIDNINHPRRLVKLDKLNFTFATAFSFCDEIENYRYIDIPEDYHGDFSDLPEKQYKIKE